MFARQSARPVVRLVPLLALVAGASLSACTLFGDPADHVASGTVDDTARPLCRELCEKVDDTCGDFSPYDSTDHCFEVCADLADGPEDDYNGDTVHCRLNHLTFAADDPGLHCPHAGPDGAGVCVGEVGPPIGCDAYCSTLAEQCADVFRNIGDRPLCVQRCNQLMADGSEGDLTSDTIQCRMTFLEQVQFGAPKMLCEALPFDATIARGCNDGPMAECQAFCLLSDAYCPDNYPDRLACEQDCQDALASSPGFVDCALYTIVEGPSTCGVVNLWDESVCN